QRRPARVLPPGGRISLQARHRLRRRVRRPLRLGGRTMKPLAAFLIVFAVALVLSGVTAARARTFQSASCNTATPQPTASMPRGGQANYAIVAAWDGYQWGGGCWNNDDRDAAPPDPPQQFTAGEGSRCSRDTL